MKAIHVITSKLHVCEVAYLQNQHKEYEWIFTHHHYKKTPSKICSATQMHSWIFKIICISEPGAHIICNSLCNYTHNCQLKIKSFEGPQRKLMKKHNWMSTLNYLLTFTDNLVWKHTNIRMKYKSRVELFCTPKDL